LPKNCKPRTWGNRGVIKVTGNVINAIMASLTCSHLFYWLGRCVSNLVSCLKKLASNVRADFSYGLLCTLDLLKPLKVNNFGGLARVCALISFVSYMQMFVFGQNQFGIWPVTLAGSFWHLQTEQSLHWHRFNCVHFLFPQYIWNLLYPPTS